jgi:polysaccharide biosynthesis protein PslA
MNKIDPSFARKPPAREIVVADTHSRQTARMALYTRLLIGDLLAMLVGFSVSREVRANEWFSMDGIDVMWVLFPLYPLMAAYVGAYSMDVLINFSESVRRALRALTFTFFLLFAGFFLTQTGEEISRLGIAIFGVITALVMIIPRYFAHRWVKRALGGVLVDELLIVDGVERPAVPTRYVVDARDNQLEPDLDNPTMLERFSKAVSFYDRILVACPPERQADWATLLKTIDARGEILVTEHRQIGVIGLGNFGPYGTLLVSRGQLELGDRIKKRLFDLAFAIPAIIVLAPMLIAVAIMIKLDSPGPVFFRQMRVGKNNVPFRIYKFRSMRQEACDADGRQSTQREDARISRFGSFIRRTSIDEIPQLFNVVKGEMSIVGPRPHALGSTAGNQLFWEISSKYWERHSLKPGITGLAQVRGYRGATETREDLTMRLQCDLEYLENWSVWRDFAIVSATLAVLIHPNAY